MAEQQREYCCPMRRKVVLGIARVRSEEECGIPDSVMADFHNFAYESRADVPVAASLTTRFCSWCGAERGPDSPRDTTEVIRPHH